MTDETNPWRVLAAHQAAIARAFLIEREAERRHVVVYLSGAHAYGFPSPDSDLDLKCVHVAKTRDLVGLEADEGGSERMEVREGVELDYGSNELGPVLRGVIRGNGNFIERLLGDLVLGGDRDLLLSAREVVRPLLSRRVGRHYAGFAASQLRLFGEKPTAKRALYVLRTAATGRHLLATGELVTDLLRLAAYAPAEHTELLAIKQRGEQSQLPAEQAEVWQSKLRGAIDAVDAAWPASVLPAEPSPEAIAAADGWLRDVRRSYW
jgi:predicted nucleotidyltransferase